MTYHQMQLIPRRHPSVSCDCGVPGTLWLTPVGTGSIAFRGQWSPVTSPISWDWAWIMRADFLLTITSKIVSMGKYVLSSWQMNVWNTGWRITACLWGYCWSQNGLVLVSNFLWIPPLASYKISPFPSYLPSTASGDIRRVIAPCVGCHNTTDSCLWKRHVTTSCSDALIKPLFQHLWINFGVSTLIFFRPQLPLKNWR